MLRKRLKYAESIARYERFSPTIFPIPAFCVAIVFSMLKLLLNITDFHQIFFKTDIGVRNRLQHAEINHRYERFSQEPYIFSMLANIFPKPELCFASVSSMLKVLLDMNDFR